MNEAETTGYLARFEGASQVNHYKFLKSAGGKRRRRRRRTS